MKQHLSKQTSINLGAQLSYMKSKYPQFTSKLVSYNLIIIKGSLQPSPRSCTYEFILKYDLSGIPKIKIVSPKLVKNSLNEKIPHLYKAGNLCLYRPKYNEFKVSDYLADTIIPWTSLWLYYYELWHATGEWLGGGEHLDNN